MEENKNKNIDEIQNDDFVKVIFDGLVEELGFTDILIGCLIGVVTGGTSMVLYFSKCKKNNLGGIKNVKR